jgi:hypothetical protein
VTYLGLLMVCDLKHLLERIESHELSCSHSGNSLKLNLYGKVDVRSQIHEGHRITVARDNELVHENRHNLSRIIDCLKFCGHHEISVQGHNESEKSLNRGVFLDLVNEVAKLDSHLNKQLQDSKVSKYTSTTIQNELLDRIYDVYREALQGDINTAMFVSVQADETTDISNKTQLFSVLLWVQK